MFIETKYSLGDKVHKISHRHENVWVPCAGCNATGEVVLADGEPERCPRCYGRKGENEYQAKEWCYDGELTVGRVGYEETGTSLKEEYMCSETGIGSGALHRVDSLFPSKEEAKAEIKKRNA